MTAQPAKVSVYASNEQLNTRLRRLAEWRAADGLARPELREFGRSHLGEPLWVLRFASEPQVLQSLPRMKVLVLAQQQGDEPVGAETLLSLANALSQAGLAEVLAQADVLLVPRLNPDGAAAGTRANALGIALDEDHLLLRSPETQALARLLVADDPALIIELRQYGSPAAGKVLLRQAVTQGIQPFVARAAREWFHDPVMARLTADGLSGPEPAGLPAAMTSTLPDTARNVMGLRNAVSLVVATPHAGDTTAERDRAVAHQLTAVRALLAQAVARGQDLLKVRAYVGRDVARQACHGDIQPSPAIGARPRPCGYWLSATAFGTVERLRLLGLNLEQLVDPASLLGDRYVVHQPNDVRLADALLEMPPGSYYLPLSQPWANLAVAALEPGTSYGYLAKGLVDRPEDIARARKPLEVTEAAAPASGAQPPGQ